MISVNQFTEKLSARHYLYSSDALKKQATQLRKMSGSISKFGFNDFDLSLSEKKTLAEAIELLNKAATISAKASQTKKKMEADKAVHDKVCYEMVLKSPFGSLLSVAEKVCLIGFEAPYKLEWATRSHWSARTCMEDSFPDCLRDMSCSVGLSKGREREVLDAAWQRFNEKKPEMLRNYAHLILQIEELLKANPATVNPV